MRSLFVFKLDGWLLPTSAGVPGGGEHQAAVAGHWGSWAGGEPSLIPPPRGLEGAAPSCPPVSAGAVGWTRLFFFNWRLLDKTQSVQGILVGAQPLLFGEPLGGCEGDPGSGSLGAGAGVAGGRAHAAPCSLPVYPHYFYR